MNSTTLSLSDIDDEDALQESSEDNLFIKESIIYEVQGITTGKIYIGSTNSSFENLRKHLESRLKSYLEETAEYQSVFEIINKEEYHINVLYVMNNLTKSEFRLEKRNIIEKYINENNMIVNLIKRPILTRNDILSTKLQYDLNMRSENQSIIYEMKGMKTNKVYIGSTNRLSINQLTEDLKYKLISYKNTNNKYQIIFEIMLNENYEINILKIINNLQLKNELKKIIEKYKTELKHLLINKFLLPINKTEKLERRRELYRIKQQLLNQS